MVLLDSFCRRRLGRYASDGDSGLGKLAEPKKYRRPEDKQMGRKIVVIGGEAAGPKAAARCSR